MSELTDTVFIDLLTEQINQQLDIPVISEQTEAAAIRWCVSLFVRFIPQSIRQFCLDAADGVSAEELGRLEDVLTNVINVLVNIPGVPDFLEERIIRTIVKACLEFAKQGNSLVP